MKKLMVRTGAALLTFVVGVACALLWLTGRAAQEADALMVEASARPGPEIIDVSLCRLVAHPGDYAGRQVRVRAVYAFRNKRSALTDGSCAGGEAVTDVSSGPPVFDEIDRIGERAHGGKRDPLGPVEIVAVGTLRRLPHGSLPDAPWNEKTRFEFKLERAEGVTKSY